jgi:uncharacterized protein (TIGR03437 family)
VLHNVLHAGVRDTILVFFNQVRNEDGSLNTPDNAARAGSRISFFFTGAGLPDAPLPDGATVTGNPPTISLPNRFLVFEFPMSSALLPLPVLTAVPGFVAGLYEAPVEAPNRTGTVRVALSPYDSWQFQPSIQVSLPGN